MLSRYLSLLIIKLTFIFLLAVTSFMGIIILFDQFSSIGTFAFNFWQAILYTLLKLLIDLRILLPIACLLGTAVAISILAARSELTIMQISGYSVSKLMGIVGKTLIILLIPFIFVLEFVAPKANKYAEHYKNRLMTGTQQEQLTQNVWLRQGNQFYHIQSVAKDDGLTHIKRFRINDDMELVDYSIAETADFQDKAWTFFDIHQIEFAHFPLQERHIMQSEWNLKIPVDILRQQEKDLEMATFTELFRLWLYASEAVDGIADQQVALAFWQRLLYPFAVCLLVLMVIPMLMPKEPRVIMGLRIVLAVVVGVSFYLLTTLFGYFGVVYNLPPWLAAGMLPGLMGVAVLIFSRRSQK